MAVSAKNPQFGEVVVKKVPHWELNETLLRIFTLHENPSRRRRDVPGLRGPDRGRVVDGASCSRSKRQVKDDDPPRYWRRLSDRHHPRLVMLCSFQKEESVLVDELHAAPA